MNAPLQKYQFADIASWQHAIADQFVPLEMQAPGGRAGFYSKRRLASFHQ